MKKLTTLALSSALAFGLVACGDQAATFSERDDKREDSRDDTADKDDEPRGAAAAAAMLGKTREEGAAREAAAEDKEQATAFVDALYNSYDGDEPINAFDSPRKVFEPALAKAIETIVASDNDTGEMHNLLGADPICGCQDWGDFSHTIDSLTIKGDRATAKVTVSNFGETSARTLELVKTPSGWRIFDLGGGFRAEALAG